jgi:hypothetical protein
LASAALPDFRDVGLHRLTKDWGEGTAGSGNPEISGTGMGSPASPGDATWSHAMQGSHNWTAHGAEGDFHWLASATTSVGGPVDAPFTWGSSLALVADVQTWLDAPETNFGWALVNAHEEMIRSQKVFYAREATQNSSGEPNSLDPAWRPRLTIDFDVVSPPTGDYNGNAVVDATDYIVWRKTLDQPVAPPGSGADGDRSGVVEEGDFSLWKAQFGAIVSAAASGAAIPEPTSVLLLLFAARLAFLRKRR